MPVLRYSDYTPPLLLQNRHLQTVYPTLFRRMEPVGYERTRISTPDNDFLDLDFSRQGSRRIVVILHGLEGNSRRKYVMGMVKIFNRHGYDTVSMNFRGCSGEPNKNICFYHSGETGDLGTVVDHLVSLQKYDAIHLVGFSLGGNVLLKYLGEKGAGVSPLVRSAVALSVPCDLQDSSQELEKQHNALYMRRFIRALEQKLLLKTRQHPGKITLDGYRSIKSFRQFDDRYTAPIHGFKDAAEYWRLCSSRRYLEGIQVPALLVNALDDPFLGKGCFPFEEAERHPCFYLETPRYGGHVGFVTFNGGDYWSERRALRFIEEHG